MATSTYMPLTVGIPGSVMGGTYTNAGAPVNGTSGTFAGLAVKGAKLIDITNAQEYINTNTVASPTWTKLSALGIGSAAITAVNATTAGSVTVTDANAKTTSNIQLTFVRGATDTHGVVNLWITSKANGSFVVGYYNSAAAAMDADGSVDYRILS